MWDASLAGVAVLVVDDDEDARELNTFILRAAGAVVASAASVPEALRRLGEPWDVVVTDIWMPGPSGYDLLREVRRRAVALPVIAVTALDMPEYRAHPGRSGFTAFLTKPFDPECLVQAVCEAIGARRAAGKGSQGHDPARDAWRVTDARRGLSDCST